MVLLLQEEFRGGQYLIQPQILRLPDSNSAYQPSCETQWVQFSFPATLQMPSVYLDKSQTLTYYSVISSTALCSVGAHVALCILLLQKEQKPGAIKSLPDLKLPSIVAPCQRWGSFRPWTFSDTAGLEERRGCRGGERVPSQHMHTHAKMSRSISALSFFLSTFFSCQHLEDPRHRHPTQPSAVPHKQGFSPTLANMDGP